VTLGAPSDADQLAALRALAIELPFAGNEQVVADRVLGVIGSLFPGRAAAIRVVDIRTRESARAYVRGAPLRDTISSDGVTLTQAALDRARLKSAVAASARVVVRDRWDSPFTGMATGFSIPLAAGGELYGVLDIGYPPGADEAREHDEPVMTAIASGLAFALRNIHLQEDATGLRDYQARLLDSANALILGIDRSWRVTVCNRALLDLTGVTRDDVLGRDVRDFISGDQRQALTTAFSAALAGQHHAAFTVMLPTRQGPVRSVWSIAPVGRAGQPGPVEAVVAIGQDQSKIDALQQQIVRAERLATLGELAAGVVHELNNPLTSITVYAEYLVRKLESAGTEPTDVEKLRRIGASAQRILRFSRDLVQYARPSGKESESIDLAGVVRQSVSICEHLVERGGITLNVEVDPELPVIQAVGGQLEQVLINLITNAVHAVESGGTVTVRAQVGDEANVVIEVADSGPGVPETDRDRIFEPFFTTKPDGKGTGLGLPIVRNIVEQHRGQISVGRSDLGGAAFRVVIPIV
jgi:PAS domain S-box-containing protein